VSMASGTSLFIFLSMLPPPPSACNDREAENFGDVGPCTYTCDALVASYFPDSAKPTRCFMFDEAAQAWPDDLIAMRRDHVEWLDYVEAASGSDIIHFAVGGPRECRNVTVVTTLGTFGVEDDLAPTRVEVSYAPGYM
jgi:hypothetical protein